MALATSEDIKANAEYVRLADSFIEVPRGVSLNNHTSVDIVVEIAKEQRIDGVWPGWGHAFENSKLPSDLNANGIKYIGLNEELMSLLRDKITTNILARSAGLPLIPWSGSYGGPDDAPLKVSLEKGTHVPDEFFEKAICHNIEQAAEAALKIGYENGIMVKASKGSRGRGIRLVDNEEDLGKAFVQIQNEVVGSPIFIMEYRNNTRHLEVQIVGDKYGNAVALNGRHRTTPLLSQSIIEEGPPIIAPRDTFREMEKAAQRFIQSIRYCGAGTVEYLFNTDTGNFFFLGFNSHLQMDHLITEGLTGVNLAAIHLQVTMGIPLTNIPQIRRLYKRAINESSPINFLEEDCNRIHSHIISAHVTPHDSTSDFKPETGKIELIKYQSIPGVWGFLGFSVSRDTNDFVDLHFCHLFAEGSSRELARRSLELAFKEIQGEGQFRMTREHLVRFLESETFQQNLFNNSWLNDLSPQMSEITQSITYGNNPKLLETRTDNFQVTDYNLGHFFTAADKSVPQSKRVFTSDSDRALIEGYGQKVPLPRPSRLIDDPLSLRYNKLRLKRSNTDDNSKKHVNLATSIVFGGPKSASDLLKCCIDSLEQGMATNIQMAVIVAYRRVHGGGRRREDTFNIHKSNQLNRVIKSVKVQSVSNKLGKM